ncbi:MAG: hypothetical protein HKN30_00685 [Sulfitobacter sp.]|nr:hypothetical protein [Sulfitobacter sp.]
MFRSFLIFLFLSPAYAAQADVWSFATPSGNIECWVGVDVGGSDISCTIFNRSKPASVPQLASCSLNQGVTVMMQNRGSVSTNCARPGDKPGGAQHVADYGVTGTFGGFVCRPSTRGLECQNEDGHGFFLSRAQQRVF